MQDASLGALAFQTACAVPAIPTVTGTAATLLAPLFAASLAWMISRRRIP